MSEYTIIYSQIKSTNLKIEYVTPRNVTDYYYYYVLSATSALRSR